MTREKRGKKGKHGKQDTGSNTAPPESGPPTVDNLKAADVLGPPTEPPDDRPTQGVPTIDERADEPVSTIDEPPAHEVESARETEPEPAQALAGDEPDAGEGAVEIEDARELTDAHLRGLLEALVFASDKPMKSNELARLASAPVKQVKAAMGVLRGEYATRGIVLDEVAGGWLFRTNAQFAPFVRELAGGRPVKLSRAQVETLAIAAYRQPITRPEIDEIRGVDSGATLKLLLERDLVRILGKKDEPGRPLLYGTTTHFLEFFNLKSLRDLPTLREFTELSDESRRVAEAELGDVLPDMNPAPSAFTRDAGEPTKPSFEQETLADDERDTIGPPAPDGDPPRDPSHVPPSEDPWPDSGPPTTPTDALGPDGEPPDDD